jgi:molybdenum-dependent DNA-binding transcriptional regulator ModE
MFPEFYYEIATARQKEVLDATKEAGTKVAAAKKLGMSYNGIKKHFRLLKVKAAKRGLSPEHGFTKVVPEGFAVKGTSTLYKNGEAALQWVKTCQDQQQQYELMQEAIEALSEDLPKVLPTKATHKYEDLMAVYPLGDPHIGMLSWGEESGMDWDLQIAEQKFISVFDRLVKVAPRCKEAVIVNLGDFFHSDNMDGVTARSGHSLDMDGRYAKMIRVGVKVLRRMIESALEHHELCRVINETGNHDDTGAMFLNIALDNIYENEPRVIVDAKPTPFHYIQFGKTCFGVHHGHSCKMANLPLVMATDEPKMWGECVHRYWLTGHIHHDSMKEYAGCKVESFRTLAAKDAYATWGGYRSGQDSKCLVMHKEYGEIERHTINIGMV